MSDLPLVLARLPEVKAVVFDLDGTLHEGYIATSIYRGLWKNPKKGIKATVGIMRGLQRAVFTRADRAHRLKRLLESVNSWTKIPKPIAFLLAETRIRTKPIQESRKILEAAQKGGKQIFLVTNGPDIGPLIYSRLYSIRDWIANPVLYETGMVKSFDLIVRPRNIAQKTAQLLALHDLKPRDCMVVADNKYYLPLMRKAKVSVASPKARRAVKKAAHYRL